MNLSINTLPKTTASVLEKIKNTSKLKDFYLSGGTALSLQLGHRESEDLNFFSQNNFDPQLLQQALLPLLYYPYNLLEKPSEWNSIFLSSTIDIACTKLITISMRGSKKDFIDLYVILQKVSLGELFIKLDKKYQKVQYSKSHILKSLVYFDDAEDQPMPRMHIPLEWETVKDFMIQEIKKVTFD